MDRALQDAERVEESAMRRSQFSAEDIVGFLEEAASGAAVEALCDEHGFSPATFFRWKARYEGMGTDHAARFRALEAEAHELRRQVRMAHRERDAIQLLLKEAYGDQRERRLAIMRLQREGGLSERRACDVFGTARTTHRRGSPVRRRPAPLSRRR